MAHQSDLIARDIDAYLDAHQHKSLLRFITCGSVDDGKSTLIGRLLWESKMVFEDTLAALERDFGASLFLRGASGYSLTTQGRRLLDVTEPLAAQLDRVEREVRGHAGQPRDGGFDVAPEVTVVVVAAARAVIGAEVVPRDGAVVAVERPVLVVLIPGDAHAVAVTLKATVDPTAGIVALAVVVVPDAYDCADSKSKRDNPNASIGPLYKAGDFELLIA